MLHKYSFISGHLLKDRDFLNWYKFAKNLEFKSDEVLQKYQNKCLRELIRYSYYNIPYYHNMFKEIGLKPENIKSIGDLEKLPILTKDIIRNHRDELIPVNLSNQKYIEKSTGGTTGTPLRYKQSKRDETVGLALMYANWGYGGYELGDRVGVIAGSSLIPRNGLKFIDNLKLLILNMRRYSSFDLSETYMKSIIYKMDGFKPNYLRGYPTAIYLLAKYIEANDLQIEFYPNCIFTTSENLFDHQRVKIEKIFNCSVFDQYGLNDGGVSAYECHMHEGYHIDCLRSIMEVVDNDSAQMENGIGRILATSLHNYAMPFIRYDTGDLGHITDDICSCGRNHKLLKEIIGRSVDVLVTPEGKNVHGWFFLYIFWEYFVGIKEYQVIQEKTDEIVIRMVVDKDFDEAQLDEIKAIIETKSKKWNVKFDFVDKIDKTSAGKYKFIINNVGGQQ